MHTTTTHTVPRSALPNATLLWQVTVQPEDGERIDSSTFVLDLTHGGR
jgi:hypothetical protein